MGKNFKKRARRRRMITANRTISRTCAVCGKELEIEFTPMGRPKNARYFGKIELPIPDTGEYVKTGETSDVLGDDVEIIKWTGKKKEVEYWECPECFACASEGPHKLEGVS